MPYPPGMTLVGVISDTHGLLRPEAVEALRESDVLLHAGDIGSQDLLVRLREIAPVHAVRGNVDTEAWSQKLPTSTELTVEGVRIALYHGHLRPPPGLIERSRVVIQGHSHIPSLAWQGERLHLNPGSAGKRRFGQPAFVARILVTGQAADPELVDLLASGGTS